MEEKNTCSTCRWSGRSIEKHYLECHFNAPVWTAESGWAEWPLVRPTDWCGRWEKEPEERGE